MVTHLSKNKNKDNFIIGCGLNSLLDTINLMNVSVNLGFKKFLVMPPAYYKYGDKEVINYYTKLVNSVPESKISNVSSHCTVTHEVLPPYFI